MISITTKIKIKNAEITNYTYTYTCIKHLNEGEKKRREDYEESRKKKKKKRVSSC